MPMRNRKELIIAAALIVLLAGVFIKNRNNNSASKNQKAKVSRGNMQETLTISGSIAADERVVLQFQTSGRLSWVGVKEGDHIRKDQLIATLDQRELKKKLQEYLNIFSKSRIDLDQARSDNKDQALTDAIRRTLDKTQFTLNNTVLDVEIQDIALQYSRLTTPIEGIVTMVQAPYAGVNIIPTGAQFEVINPKTIYFSALADQTEVTELKNGMKGVLNLDSYSDEKIGGMIKKISYTPKTGETGTVYGVTFIPEKNEDYTKYRIGMTGDLTFVTKEKNNVLYVPVSFVTGENGNSYVTVMEKNKKVKKKVTTGMETDSSIEITSGLKEGDVVYD